MPCGHGESFLSMIIFAYSSSLYFEKKFKETDGDPLPETRLIMTMPAAFLFPISLFWFAWTANKTSWVSPVIATSIFGIGAVWTIMPVLLYLPQAYPETSGSALSSNAFVRTILGAAMPIVATAMFANLGVAWGNTLLGCLTVLFIPIPFGLYYLGPKLRAKSPLAKHDD